MITTDDPAVQTVFLGSLPYGVSLHLERNTDAIGLIYQEQPDVWAGTTIGKSSNGGHWRAAIAWVLKTYRTMFPLPRVDS